jgi:alpha-beta hydrolase superfamily lysophospholipase
MRDMLNLIGRTLLFWLSIFELLASWRGWWGLSWLGHRFPHRLLAPLPPAALLGARGSHRQIAGSLALAAPIALAFQIAASSLRNYALNPLLWLRPGRYDDRTIVGVGIPLREGYLPALHVIPRSGATMAICILHGSGDHKTAYTWWLVDALLAQGLAALLIDLDGHGENPRPQSFPAITEDVAAAVGWLRARHEQVGVLGISMGGCVAARAVADGVAVDALAVLEAPPILSYRRADVWREALALARPGLLDLFSDCTVYQIVHTWSTAPIRATISTWDLIAALDLPGSLARVTAPTLLLYGANDAIIKPTQAEQVRRAAPPGATFRLVPRTSHLTLILDPQVLREIGEWFADVVKRKA